MVPESMSKVVAVKSMSAAEVRIKLPVVMVDKVRSPEVADKLEAPVPSKENPLEASRVKVAALISTIPVEVKSISPEPEAILIF